MLIFLLAAGYQDYRYDKIKNRLIAAGIAGGLWIRILEDGPKGIFYFGEGFLVILFLLYPLFKINGIGAGDVKMFAVCAGTIGLKKGFHFLLAAFLAAAVLSLLKMLYEHNLIKRFRCFFRYTGQVVSRAEWLLYVPDDKEYKKRVIHLAGPACLSLLLLLGGVY